MTKTEGLVYKGPAIVSLTSCYEICPLPVRTAKAIWKGFLAYKVSSHSARACTLPYIVRRAEQEKIPYRLEAWPGEGYTVQRVKV